MPDSDMLIALSEVFEIPVSTLLGETIVETKVDDLRAIAEKLEVINLQLAQRKATILSVNTIMSPSTRLSLLHIRCSAFYIIGKDFV